MSNPVLHKGIHDFRLTSGNIARIAAARLGCPRRASSRGQPSAPAPPSPSPCAAGEAVFTPGQRDTLFWCFYIMQNGRFAYETVKDKSFVEEKRVKIELVTELRAADLKFLAAQSGCTLKWKKQQLEEELVTAKRISLKTFLCLCALHRHKVCVVLGRMVQSLEGTGTAQIVQATGERYGVDLSDTAVREKKCSELREGLWTVTDVTRPLRALSGYKVAELRDICKKLCLACVGAEGKAYTKKRMYAAIQERV